ncbi:MAG: hypothetical protein U1F83_03035 [Verrucomicrobiota bacterium]
MSVTAVKSDRPVRLGEWDEILQLADDVIQALLARMSAAQTRGDLEGALQWGHAASGFIVFGGTFGRLVSLELERATVSVAGTLPRYEWKRNERGSPRILHVLTEAYELFGHTKLCRKWIEIDSSPARHDVVLLAQEADVPENLRRSVESRGGRLTKLDPTQPLLERARRLREIAFAEADAVVLHVHPQDLLPNVAFGVPGGPPVIYVNHADHEFWVGGAVTDLVLDIRESGQEWTRWHRDIPRSRILPVPLEEDPLLLGGVGKMSALRGETRKSLGIADKELVFLTIGSARKYEPMQGMSFLEAAEAILNRCPQARMIAVGPRPVGEWQAVAQRTGGRLMPVGNQSGLGRFHAAADVYLEGMPAGSLTALLEVCLAGVPCVRAPARVRPPHASDGSALASVAQPVDVPAYVNEAVALAENETERRERGRELQRSVRETHCEIGWRRQLEQIIPSLPKVHSLYPSQNPRPIAQEESEFKLDYAYHDVTRGRVGVMATLVTQAIRYCPESRRAAEAVLPETLSSSSLSPAIEQKLFEAILPELRVQVSGRTERSARPVLDPAVVAKELMVLAAGDGRRCAAWRLAARMARQSPGIVRHLDFRKGLVKSLPGSAALVRWVKSRRK